VRAEKGKVMNEDIIIREVGGHTFELKPHYTGYGVFLVDGGSKVELTEGVDLPDLDLLTDEVLLALTEPRRRALIAVMAGYRIVSGVDYRYEEDYELLYSTTPVGRYVVVSGDEKYHWIWVADTREEAADGVRGEILDQRHNEYPHHPEEILDLDTGRAIRWKAIVSVELEN
jgi:hypothetical protein